MNKQQELRFLQSDYEVNTSELSKFHQAQNGNVSLIGTLPISFLNHFGKMDLSSYSAIKNLTMDKSDNMHWMTSILSRKKSSKMFKEKKKTNTLPSLFFGINSNRMTKILTVTPEEA